MFYFTRKKFRKKLSIVIIMAVTTITVITAIKSFDPIFENLCKDRAIKISTKILNEESTTILKEYDYKDIVLVTKTEESNIFKYCITSYQKIRRFI